MTGTVLEEALSDDPACVTAYTGQSTCLAARPMAARQLSDEDVSTLEALIEAFPPDRCAVDESLECDFCRVGTITVDGVKHEKTCCGTQQTTGYDEAFLALESFVDGLLR